MSCWWLPWGKSVRPIEPAKIISPQWPCCSRAQPVQYAPGCGPDNAGHQGKGFLLELSHCRLTMYAVWTVQRVGTQTFGFVVTMHLTRIYHQYVGLQSVRHNARLLLLCRPRDQGDHGWVLSCLYRFRALMLPRSVYRSHHRGRQMRPCWSMGPKLVNNFGQRGNRNNGNFHVKPFYIAKSISSIIHR